MPSWVLMPCVYRHGVPGGRWSVRSRRRTGAEVVALVERCTDSMIHWYQWYQWSSDWVIRWARVRSLSPIESTVIRIIEVRVHLVFQKPVHLLVSQLIRWLTEWESLQNVRTVPTVSTASAKTDRMMCVTVESERLSHTLDSLGSHDSLQPCMNASNVTSTTITATATTAPDYCNHYRNYNCNLLNLTHLPKISPKDRAVREVVPNFTIGNLLVWIPILIPLLLQSLVVPIVGGKRQS